MLKLLSAGSAVLLANWLMVLDQDKMEELLKQKKFSIGYTATKELPVILTESPTQLRKKLPELLKQKDVLEEGFFFRRLNSDRQPIQP